MVFFFIIKYSISGEVENIRLKVASSLAPPLNFVETFFSSLVAGYGNLFLFKFQRFPVVDVVIG